MVDMSALVATLRRFGLSGPAYEVLGPAAADQNGLPQMRIRVLESGEELDYPVRDIMADPIDE
jgi:hypothetical protein